MSWSYSSLLFYCFAVTNLGSLYNIFLLEINKIITFKDDAPLVAFTYNYSESYENKNVLLVNIYRMNDKRNKKKVENNTIFSIIRDISLKNDNF